MRELGLDKNIVCLKDEGYQIVDAKDAVKTAWGTVSRNDRAFSRPFAGDRRKGQRARTIGRVIEFLRYYDGIKFEIDMDEHEITISVDGTIKIPRDSDSEMAAAPLLLEKQFGIKAAKVI
jgi:hypothetical protein